MHLPFGIPNTVIPHFSSPREELSILVETTRHDSISSIEGLFDSISMMHVDIDVEDSGVVSEQFENTEDNI